jgi:hypothetical protein
VAGGREAAAEARRLHPRRWPMRWEGEITQTPPALPALDAAVSTCMSYPLPRWMPIACPIMALIMGLIWASLVHSVIASSPWMSGR